MRSLGRAVVIACRIAHSGAPREVGEFPRGVGGTGGHV